MTHEMQPSMGLKAAIELRRATRTFHHEPIPDTLLEEILRLGLRAPSGYNLQPWRFIVVQEQENREKLKACAFNQDKIAEAPVVLICCGDRRVNNSEYIEQIIDMGKQEGAINDEYANAMRSLIPNLFENQPCFDHIEAWTNRHTMIAVTHIMLAAKSFGVDSCPMEGFVTTQVKEAFKIPDEVDVCCLLALGFAADPHKKYGGRFGMDEVCFGESYGQAFEL